jgi:hypothetical protein
VRLELTTLGLLDPRSNQLSYTSFAVIGDDMQVDEKNSTETVLYAMSLILHTFLHLYLSTTHLVSILSGTIIDHIFSIYLSTTHLVSILSGTIIGLNRFRWHLLLAPSLQFDRQCKH